MPLVRVDMLAGKSPELRAALGEAVQSALHGALDVPLEERFQVIAEHPPGGLVVDPGYLGVARSADAIIVQVTLNRGRDAAKKKLFATLAAALQAATGIRREDVVVSLVEVGREDWSFGNGEAQLA